MTKLTRDDIVIGAGKRFGTYGYHGTSMRDLGNDLGILGSSIYAHVGGKHELLVAVVERAGQLFDSSADAAIELDLGPIETLRALVHGHIDVLIDYAPEATTFLNEAVFLEPEDRARITKARDEYEAVFRATIQRGIESGDFRPDVNPKLVGIYILSILNATLRWYKPGGGLDRIELTDDIVELVVGGIRAI
jgi:AcrR family transcriptional regulator